MTLMENTHGQYVQVETSSSAGEAEKLRTRVRYILDRLAEHAPLPYGVTFKGVVTNDHHGNRSLYVFLKDKDGGIHPGDREGTRNVRYLPETEGGHWISLNKGDGAINYQWEARDLNKAIAEYRMKVQA